MPDHGVKVARDGAEHPHILATHYLTVWERYVAFREQLVSNASEIVEKYLIYIRSEHHLVSFIAFDGTTAVETVSCRSDFKAYPVVLKAISRRGLHMECVHRSSTPGGKGTGRMLMQPRYITSKAVRRFDYPAFL